MLTNKDGGGEAAAAEIAREGCVLRLCRYTCILLHWATEQWSTVHIFMYYRPTPHLPSAAATTTTSLLLLLLTTITAAMSTSSCSTALDVQPWVSRATKRANSLRSRRQQAAKAKGPSMWTRTSLFLSLSLSPSGVCINK